MTTFYSFFMKGEKKCTLRLQAIQNQEKNF